HAPVVARQNRAELAAGVERVQKFDAVMRDDPDAVAFADAHLVAQPVGETVSALVHLAIGVVRAIGLARIDYRQPVRRVDRAPTKRVANVHLSLLPPSTQMRRRPSYSPRHSRRTRPARRAAAPSPA